MIIDSLCSQREMPLLPESTMPELPEVETTRIGLNQRAVSAKINAVFINKPLRWPLGCKPNHLIGRVLLSWSRRGKYLVAHLDKGYLLIHLGMSGSLRFLESDAARSVELGTHDHVCLQMSIGDLRLNDPRRFGAVVFVEQLSDPVAIQLLGRLGLEPLAPEFTFAAFEQRLKQKRGVLKQVLLTGHVVVGVGNIYASEVLFLSGLHPQITLQTLDTAAIERLYKTIPLILNEALAKGGTTLKNYVNVAGESGNFQHQTWVYGREGKICMQCRTGHIQRLVQQQRSTYYCPVCQSL